MGTVYLRGKRLWLAYVDEHGERQWKPARRAPPHNTPLLLGEEKEAQAILDGLERMVRARKRHGDEDGRPVSGVTVTAYAKWWVADRRRRGMKCADDDEDRLEHALPVLGHMRMDKVERVHVRDLFRDLMAKKEIAPRTILHVYGVLRVMFGDAREEGLVQVSPCTLLVRKRELPKKRDKNPQWRAKAVFARDELEQLISDPRIPEDRRVMYGLIFLGGPRINEMTPRRWRDLDHETKPLAALAVETALERKTRKEGPVKTEWPRVIPVHPTLAKMLARWKLSGWTKYQGRAPAPDDLIVPNVPAKGKAHKAKASPYLHSNRVWKWLQRDLEALGLRRRRVHDTRRTFISLARGDGARKDLLHFVTHGPEKGDMDDLYTTPPWPDLCAEVVKLRVRLREGKVLTLAREGAAR